MKKKKNIRTSHFVQRKRKQHNSHWAVGELLSSEEKKNCCSEDGLADLSSWVFRVSNTDRGCNDDGSSRCNWFLIKDFIFECFVADGTIKPEGITFERLKFAGRSKNDDDDEDVVDAGEIGVNVREEDEQVEFVGLGQILGELGGGKRSLSGCWIGLKCVWSLPLVVDDADEGAEDKMFRDCCVVSRLLVVSIKPGDGDSLEEKYPIEISSRLGNGTYGELVGPNKDSLSLTILVFLLFNPEFDSSPSRKERRVIERYHWQAEHTFSFQIRWKWSDFRWWTIGIITHHCDWTLRPTRWRR